MTLLRKRSLQEFLIVDEAANSGAAKKNEDNHTNVNCQTTTTTQMNKDKAMPTEIDGDFRPELMSFALAQASIGRTVNEIPVGCILYNHRSKKAMAQSHNKTVETRNGTKHCEIVCIEYLFMEYNLRTLSDFHLYVTVEPCIMCASALSIMNIGKVFYGCKNEKFGGNGGILTLNLKNAFSMPMCDGYPSIFVGHYLPEFKRQSISLLKTFYEHGNIKLPQTKRARTRKPKDSNAPNASCALI